MSPEVTLDPELTQMAEEAAKACKDAGRLGHDLGHFTEKCNLGGGKGGATTAGLTNWVDLIHDTMEEWGENNRAQRGHRMLALGSILAKTGFGLDGGYGAQYARDTSGQAVQTSYAYPGKGWYPAARVHGDSWSLYLPDNAPAAAELKVRVWKLAKAPKEALKDPAAPAGKEVKIKAVFTLEHAINFEPEITAKRGAYWVQVEGGGVNESYLVDLY